MEGKSFFIFLKMNKKSFFGQILPQKTDQSFNQYQYHCINIQNHCIKIQKYKSPWKIGDWRDIRTLLSYNHRKESTERSPDKNHPDARIAPLPTCLPIWACGQWPRTLNMAEGTTQNDLHIENWISGNCEHTRVPKTWPLRRDGTKKAPSAWAQAAT